MHTSLRHLTSFKQCLHCLKGLLQSTKYMVVQAQRTDVSNPPASESLCPRPPAGVHGEVIQGPVQQASRGILQSRYEQRVF